jgi:hypoxanthine phosphoribosyltransferase
MKKIYYTDADVRGWVHEIIRDLHEGSWRPDYIVGLTRGGLTPALMLSHYLGVPMRSLDVSLRDGDECTSNLSMAEDAFGWIEGGYQGLGNNSAFDYTIHAKRILIVDDINDSGATLAWIREDWQSSCLPNHDRWLNVWHHNVRTAVLVNNTVSEFSVDYSGTDINKLEDPVWCVFPWEAWWQQ